MVLFMYGNSFAMLAVVLLFTGRILMSSNFLFKIALWLNFYNSMDGFIYVWHAVVLLCLLFAVVLMYTGGK